MKVFQCLVLWATLYAISTWAVPLDNSSVVPFTDETVTTTDISSRPFIWSCLGDSWASGVSYALFGATDFDGNKDGCMRVKHAYSVQMHTDDHWIPDGRQQAFYFQACSGTPWLQINKEPFQGHIQLDDIQPNTDMILLQVGGNNANFGIVAYACIFTPEGKDFGPHYPDKNGDCYKELERAEAYINNREKNGLFQDARYVVNKIFEHQNTWNDPNFRLFVAGYWEFFYDMAGDGDWCDSVSFALRYDNRPHLTLALRQKINQLIRRMNAVIEEGVKGSFYPERAKFLYTDKTITNTRFCMPGQNLYQQYWGNDVLLWNMSPEGVIFANSGNDGADGQNSTYEVRDPIPAQFDHLLETGRFTDDPREIPTNMTAIANAGLAHAGLAKSDGVAMGTWPDWLDMIGPYQNNFPGMTLRPFHPKSDGHTSIAQTLIEQIKQDYRDRPIINTRSIQILLAKHNGRFAWYAYQGPQGIKVDPCNADRDGFKTRFFDVKENRPNLSINNPPFIDATIWSFDFGARGYCFIKLDANGPGTVGCNDGYLLYVQNDASWDGGVFQCSGWAKGYEWHRAWTIEWYPRPVPHD